VTRGRVLIVAAVVAACSQTPSALPAGTIAPSSPTLVTPPASAADTPVPTATAPRATGKGVTVVIIDRGIDWRSPEFVNDDGTTRIRGILDLSGQTSYCSQDRPKPAEYTEAQINAALSGGTDLPTHDAIGHGTATAGLAAGSGRSLASRALAGVAPEADLLIGKAHSEAAPAHDGKAAEPAVHGCLDDALAWVDTKIAQLGQPAVALWNAGTQWGPLDGTSEVSRGIEATFPATRPGRIWVASSGDEGGLPNHAGGVATAGAPLVVPFALTADAAYPTAWYDGDGLAVTIRLADGTTAGPVVEGATATAGGVTVTQYRPGKEFSPWTSTSGDHGVWMTIQGHRGAVGSITFATAAGDDRHVDLYGDVLGPDPLTSAIDFNDHLVPGRLNDVSTTRGVIVTGVYVAVTAYDDVDGQHRDFSREGQLGALWYRSSGGPTRDGRLAVDIAAAGQGVPAPLAAGAWWSSDQFRSLFPAIGAGKYIRFGGTSAAGPIVVGTIALMLQANPDLTTEDVRRILHETALADSLTGAVPNGDWGAGKLDITAAVAAAMR
jgi:subtilisin family serine protease